MTWPLRLPSVTVPAPWVAPNPVPVIVTEVPADPEVGLIPAMCGVLMVNGTPLLQLPF